MDVFSRMQSFDHEQVLHCWEPHIGLRAIIAVHDTRLGPALGGCRILPYATEEAALHDVLRLSRGMTYKAAIAGLDLGGGKSVILADPRQKTEALLRAFGRYVHSLGGRYLVAEDMNTTARDMEWIARETPFVTGLAPSHGGLGEPGPVTAFGVFHGIRAALEHRFGSPDVAGRRVAIQGLGSVGENLGELLHERGARLVVSDLDAGRVDRAVTRWGATAVAGEDYAAVECDVLAPCAVGGILGGERVDRVRAAIVAGGANNILVDEVADAERLAAREIVVAPDYVINAGGLITMYAEWTRGDLSRAMADTEGIYDTTLAVLQRSRDEGVTPHAASRSLAEERMARIAQTRQLYAPASRPPEGPPYYR